MRDTTKRIAQNSVALYIRTLFNLVISLYTSRLFLNILGVEDFGIYNVVGGMVSMFTIISGSLSAAISRFLTYELGTGNHEKLRATFSTSVMVQIVLSVIIVILIETVGLWYLNHKMVISPERMGAAHWVLHCSMITTVVNLMSLPYNALIIAHERMKTFAYISVAENLLKFIILAGLYFIAFDSLKLYAVLFTLSAMIIRIIYGIYCKRHFSESKIIWKVNKPIFKEMFAFAGWNTIGSSSVILKDQGVNMVLNLFFGTTINAARGIAVQVNGAITNFVNSFTSAISPQVTKSYASGDKDYMMSLIFRGAKFSFFMLMMLAISVLLETDTIIIGWLKIAPEHTTNFVRLILINSLCDILSSQLITAQLATGKIRNYQIIVGGLQMLNLPISYFCLRLGYSPESTMVASIVIAQICLFARLFMLRGMIGINVRAFVIDVFFKSWASLGVALVMPYFVMINMPQSTLRFIVVALCCLVSGLASIYFIGCNKGERMFINEKIITLTNKLKRK